MTSIISKKRSLYTFNSVDMTIIKRTLCPYSRQDLKNIKQLFIAFIKNIGNVQREVQVRIKSDTQIIDSIYSILSNIPNQILKMMALMKS